jgi:hypothetical protein
MPDGNSCLTYATTATRPDLAATRPDLAAAVGILQSIWLDLEKIIGRE